MKAKIGSQKWAISGTIGGMDPLSALTSLLTLGHSAKAVVERYEPSGRALYRCVEHAMRGSLTSRDDSLDELATALLRTFSLEDCRRLFLDDVQGFGSSEGTGVWAHRFENHIDATGVVDEALDLTALAWDFAERLLREVLKEAQTPNSPLFGPLVLDRLEALSRWAADTVAPSSTVRGVTSKGALASEPLFGISNLADLPMPLGIVDRPEISTVRERWAMYPMVVLAGEPGTGKSVLAQSIVRTGDWGMFWWFNGSTVEDLHASCETLLQATSRVPGRDPVAEVRELLGSTSGWNVVVDDAIDRTLVETVIPGNCAPGSVIVTTRNGNAFARETVVPLGAVDTDTAKAMARVHLDGDDTDEALIRLLKAAEGNPLVIVSISRFKSTSGSTWERVFALLETQPKYLLSHGEGTGYPASFFEVVTTALDSAAGLSDGVVPVMAALSVCGGEVPRILLEASSITDPTAADLDGAVQQLKAAGIIGTTTGRITCHSLIAHVAGSYYSSRTRSAMVQLLFRMVDTLCTSTVTVNTHPQQLTAVVERLDRHVNNDDPLRLGAHISLAEALSDRGWIASAQRHLGSAMTGLRTLGDGNLRVKLFTRAAAIMMNSGAYEELQDLLTDILSSDQNLDPLDRATLLVIAAWAAEGLNDADGAQSAIHEAWTLAPDHPELSGLRLHFERALNSADDRVAAYLKLVHDEMVPELSRASFASLASRDLRDLGRIDEAVEAAKLALSMDEDLVGPESQLVARDCNDLGSALIEKELFDEAATHLERSRAIYQAEDPNHPLAAIPLLHCGRICNVKAWQAGTQEECDELLNQGQQLLTEAERLIRLSSNKSTDLAAILYARAENVLESAEVFDILEEAIDIDRDFYGDNHPEIGKNRLLAFVAAIVQGKKTLSEQYLKAMKPHFHAWESENPDMVLNVLESWRFGVVKGVLPALTEIEKQSLNSWKKRLKVQPKTAEQHWRFGLRNV